MSREGQEGQEQSQGWTMAWQSDSLLVVAVAWETVAQAGLACAQPPVPLA